MKDKKINLENRKHAYKEGTVVKNTIEFSSETLEDKDIEQYLQLIKAKQTNKTTTTNAEFYIQQKYLPRMKDKHILYKGKLRELITSKPILEEILKASSSG